MPKYTVQRNNGVVAKRCQNVTTQVPTTSICETEILPTLQLAPQTPKISIPSHQTTAHKLASLLQEVASIMDTITGEKMMCGEELDGLEGDILGGLTEMVLIMEEEVEEMIELADIVEEYVEELEMAELDGLDPDLSPSKDSSGSQIGEDFWGSQGSEMAGWKGNLDNTALGKGKESIRIGLDDNVKGRLSLGELLEEVEEDVLGWRARGMSINSENYEFDERSEVVVGAGVFVPITNYKKEEVIKPTVLSLPRKHYTEAGFRDSGLGLLSPAGIARKPMKKVMEPRIVVKSSPIGLRTGLGRKKTVKKPKWV